MGTRHETNYQTANPSAGSLNRFASLPQKFGRYQLQEKIGAGGMGMVFKAVHTSLKQVVALKTIRSDRLPADAELAIRRFYREMEAAGAVIHPHVARATDAGEEDGIHFLITEFIDGVDLQQLNQKAGPLSAGVACELLYQACQGLEAIRAQGMVHRDIKPSNLLVSWEGQLKIVDLGLVRGTAGSLSSDQLTGSNVLLGTVDFLAPEQALDARDIDIRADIYSIGCTLFWLVTANFVFRAPKYHTAAQKIRAHCDVEPPWDRLRAVDERLVPLAQRMLAKEPADRYQTPGELAKLLEPLRDPAGLQAALTTARRQTKQNLQDTNPHSAMDTVSFELDTTIRANPLVFWQQPRVLLAVGAAVLLGIAAIVAFRFWSLSTSQPDSSQAVTLSLDEIPSREWHNVLTFPPRELLWRNTVTPTRWHYDPGLEQVVVPAGELGLLEFGQTSLSDFKLHVGLKQNRWKGGIGIFWGAHFDTHENTEVVRYQYLQIQETTTRGEPQFVLTRGRGVAPRSPGPGEEFRGEQTSLISQDIPKVPREQQILEVTVMHHRLQSVEIDDRSFDDLVQPEINDQFDPQDYVGSLGAWVNFSDGTFQKARFMRLGQQ